MATGDETRAEETKKKKKKKKKRQKKKKKKKKKFFGHHAHVQVAVRPPADLLSLSFASAVCFRCSTPPSAHCRPPASAAAVPCADRSNLHNNTNATIQSVALARFIGRQITYVHVFHHLSQQ
jgi:hypothetical protein